MSGWKEKLFYAIEAMKGNKGNDKNTFGTKICANFKATLISCPSVSCLNLLCQFQKASQLGGLEGLEMFAFSISSATTGKKLSGKKERRHARIYE